jgi:hypothetical protein
MNKPVAWLTGIAASLGLLVFAWLNLTGVLQFGGETAPGEFIKFYRVKIDLTFEKVEPVTVDYIVACRGKTNEYIGDSVSRFVRVPRVYGVATKAGHGIMTVAPDVCSQDLKKIVPDDFLPVMFYAEKAGDMSFFTAYLSELSYDQKFSHMMFHKATVTEVSRADYDKWKKESSPNIVPQVEGPWWAEVFNNEYWQKQDWRYGDFEKNPRSFGPISCTSVVRRPVSAATRDLVRKAWPTDHPRYWVMQSSEFITAVGSGRPMQYGVRRVNGGGTLHIDELQNFRPEEIELRSPFYRSILYPEAIPKHPIQRIEYRVTTADGADQGFAYCVRDWGGGIKFNYDRNGKFEFKLDNKLLAEVSFNPDFPIAPMAQIFENDQYQLAEDNIYFEDEWAEMR